MAICAPLRLHLLVHALQPWSSLNSCASLQHRTTIAGLGCGRGACGPAVFFQRLHQRTVDNFANTLRSKQSRLSLPADSSSGRLEWNGPREDALAPILAWMRLQHQQQRVHESNTQHASTLANFAGVQRLSSVTKVWCDANGPLRALFSLPRNLQRCSSL